MLQLLRHYEVLVTLANDAASREEYGPARKLFEECISLCKYGIDIEPFHDWQALLLVAFMDYARILSLVSNFLAWEPGL